MSGARASAAGRIAPAAEFLIAAVVFCVGLAIYYREPVFSGFERISSGRGDGRLYIFLFEHWYKTFAGVAHWADPPMFFPTPATLGYADAQFAQALPYAVFRFFGADPYLAYQLMLFTQNLIGFVGMYLLARPLLGAPWWLALGAAFAVAFSSGMHGQLAHAQIQTFTYYPAILCFFVAAGQRLADRPRQAALLAALGGLALAALFLTGYYPGFFFVLIGGATLVLYAVFDQRHVRGLLARRGRRIAAVAASGFVACLIGLIPFFVIHLPPVLAGQRRAFAEVMHYAPRPEDLLNVGSGNLLWGWVPQVFTSLSPQRLTYGEATMAPVPLLVLGAIALWLWLVRRNRPQTKRYLRIGAALFFASGILLVMTVDFAGTSGWWIVWKLVPGGTGLRVPFRIGIAVSMALVLVIVLCGVALLKTATPANLGMRRAAVAALALLVAAGEINVKGEAGLDRRAETKWIAALPPPPAACRHFFVLDNRFPLQVTIHDWILLHTDAMMIAQQTGIPTINGNSSILPPKWGLFAHGRQAVLASARDWIALHGLQDGICIYDRGTNSWHVGTEYLDRLVNTPGAR